MNIIICDDLYLQTVRCAPILLHHLLGLCDTPSNLLTLKFHDLHPFLIYTPTPSVYTHSIFNCVPSTDYPKELNKPMHFCVQLTCRVVIRLLEKSAEMIY